MGHSSKILKTVSLMAFVFLLALFMAVSGWGYLPFQGTQWAQADPAQTYMDAWITDGPVYSVYTEGGVAYIGGHFDYVGPNTGSGVPISTASGSPVDPYPRVNERIQAVVPDGAGGWYIGGGFTRVGGADRNRIAHIQADGSVSSFDPGADNTVFCLALDGTTLYAGGYFTSAGGQDRNHIAAIDTTTGTATAWDPDADHNVYDLALDGTTLYVGGQFANIGGQSRSHIAALDTATSNATAFNPGVTGPVVFCLALSGSTLYAGGDFSSAGGQPRDNIAAIDTATGTATAWDPGADDRVMAMAVDGTTLYAGGYFTSAGGQSRSCIAALDTATGNATAWDPGADDWIFSLAVSGTTLYAGGYFTYAGGQDRNHIAAIDTTTGTATAWDPDAENTVLALALDGTTLYAGGYFVSVGGEERSNLAAIDIATGTATAWDPGADNSVRTIAVDGSTVYIGGAFASAGGQARNRIAALDATTGNATAWDPDADDTVRALVISGSTVYVGGFFANIGGQARENIAALDTTTGNATAWNPDSGGEIYALALEGNILYVGGYFSIIGGQNRQRIAALDTTTGNATAFDAGSTFDWVNDIVIDGSTLYVGGTFTTIGGQSRDRLAALDKATGSVTAWNPGASGQVRTLALSGNTLYVGGDFTTIGGQSRSRLAALDTTTGNATAWDPSAAHSVYGLSFSGDTLCAVGAFSTMGGELCPHLAIFPGVYTVTAAVAGGNGQVDPATQQVDHGSDAVIDITPDPGYHTDSVTDKGAPVLPTPTDSYTINNVTEDHDVEVTFAPDAGPTSTWYLAEGYTGGEFDTWVLVQNPNAEDANVTLTFQLPPGSSAEPYSFILPAGTRRSIHLDELEGLADTDVSTKVTADKQVVAERAMYFDYQGTRAGGHDSIGVTAPSDTWYLAEGYTGGEFDTWVLVQNPGIADAEVTLTFQLPPGHEADPYTFVLPAGTRKSIHLDELPGLEDTDVSTRVISNGGYGHGMPVVAERAMYFDYQGTRAGGHDSIGVTAPSDTWYLAEGYTGGEFDTWVLVQNPGTENTDVTLSFQLPPGHEADAYTFQLPAGTRKSIHLDELPGLADTDVSTRVTADKQVVAERAMYFDYQGTRAGGHDSVGVTVPADTWYLAEGYTGGEFDTWVLVQNPGTRDTSVTLSFQLPPGHEADSYTFQLPAGTRKSIHLDELPGLADTD
ncbi:MAG: hypothetical protein JW854_11365, partial [Actinobacteria bacterium]|nr:hypothetical protein [Actinomycetota bacterium]